MAFGDAWYLNMNWNPNPPVGSYTWENIDTTGTFGSAGATLSTVTYGVNITSYFESNGTVPTLPYVLASSGALYYDASRTVGTYLYVANDITLYGPNPSSSTAPTDIAGTVGTLVFGYNSFDHTYSGYFQVTDNSGFKNRQAFWGAGSSTGGLFPFIVQ